MSATHGLESAPGIQASRKAWERVQVPQHKLLTIALTAALTTACLSLAMTPAIAAASGPARMSGQPENVALDADRGAMASARAVEAGQRNHGSRRPADPAQQQSTADTGSASSGHEKKNQEKKKKKTQEKKAQNKQPNTLSAVMVTGSLIPRAEVETANPVVTITAADIKAQGFTNIYQVLRASPLQTGAIQTSVYTNGATPNAKAVSMFGLPPGFTLILLNGHPISSYPIPYNTESNFTNLSNIPLSIVKRIDILPGNESAIYGSSAIAGVINIVTKKKVTGYRFEYEAGEFTPNGGGLRQRITFSGGYNTNKLNIIYSLQDDNVHPVFGYDVPITSTSKNNPNPNSRLPYGTADIEQINPNGRVQFVDPNQSGGCGAMSGLFGGTVIRGVQPALGPVPGEPGYYCASYAEPGYSTLSNEIHDLSGYLHATYQLSDHAQLYADVLYAWQKQRSFWPPGLNSWHTGYGDISRFILNENTGLLTEYIRLFAPEETGSVTALARHTQDNLYEATFGIRGHFGDSNWNYIGYVNRSADDLTQQQPIPMIDKINAFMEQKFLGPKLGTTTDGFSIFKPDNAAFFQPVTPNEFHSFLGLFATSNRSSDQRANFQVNNTDLFDLPAGPVGFAALVEGGSQSWENLPNEALQQGKFLLGAYTQGGGSRDQQGAAVEFHVPVFKSGVLGSLDVDVAGRYDHFKNVGGTTDRRMTYKIGLAYRPMPTLLLRADAGSAFRAPDMVEVFQTPTNVQSNVLDWYKCEKYAPNVPISACPFNSTQYTLLLGGNKDLKSITAKSFGYGLVWSPTKKFDLHTDFYSIDIQNEVQVQNVGRLSQLDARCLNPDSPLGPLDPNSALCQRVTTNVKRGPVNTFNQTISEQLLSINARYINIARESLRGINSGLDYRWSWGRFGDFHLRLRYNVTLNHTLQQFPDEATHRLLHEPQWSSEFKNIASGSLTWHIGKWYATVFGVRYGSTPNLGALAYGWEGGSLPHQNAQKIPPWMIYNVAVAWHVTPDINCNLIVDNVRNTPPPYDSTWTSWPYYNQWNYNPFGRFVMVGVNIHFGAGKH